METRTTKEYALDNESTFKSKYGTLNKNNPEVIYVKAKGKIKPMVEKNSYSDDIIAVKNGLAEYVEKLVRDNDDVFLNRYIFDIDTSENGLKFNKQSRFKYDLYLVPNVIRPIEEYREAVNDVSSLISSHLEKLLSEKSISC